MSKEKTENPTTEVDEVHEYAFEKVPESQRKKGSSIFVILAGYTISLSNFVTGAAVGSQMSFKDAVLACLVGNLFLAVIAVLLGVVALHTGLSTSFLSRKALGARASSIFSFILALSFRTGALRNYGGYRYQRKELCGSNFCSGPRSAGVLLRNLLLVDDPGQ